jgi:hypothetical protein
MKPEPRPPIYTEFRTPPLPLAAGTAELGRTPLTA